MDGIRQDHTSFGGVQQFWPDSAKRVLQNQETAIGRCRIPATVSFSPFVIFLSEPNAEKYFRENYFFLK